MNLRVYRFGWLALHYIAAYQFVSKVIIVVVVEVVYTYFRAYIHLRFKHAVTTPQLSGRQAVCLGQACDLTVGKFRNNISNPDIECSICNRCINLHWRDSNHGPSVWVSKCSTNWANREIPTSYCHRSTLYQHCYILPPQVKLRPGAVGHGQLNCYGSCLGYICSIVLRTHPAPNVTVLV